MRLNLGVGVDRIPNWLMVYLRVSLSEKAPDFDPVLTAASGTKRGVPNGIDRSLNTNHSKTPRTITLNQKTYLSQVIRRCSDSICDSQGRCCEPNERSDYYADEY